MSDVIFRIVRISGNVVELNVKNVILNRMDRLI